MRTELLETSFRIRRDEVTRTLIGCPATAERQNIIRSFFLQNGGYGATAAGTATAQRNFSRMQRNSYGIFVTATAERQRNGGNQALLYAQAVHTSGGASYRQGRANKTPITTSLQ